MNTPRERRYAMAMATKVRTDAALNRALARAYYSPPVPDALLHDPAWIAERNRQLDVALGRVPGPPILAPFERRRRRRRVA